MRKVYALLVKKNHTDHGYLPVAVQFSFNKEELDGIAEAINNQVDGWGSAKVEEVDGSVAEWNFPHPYQTEMSETTCFLNVDMI